MRLLSWLFVTLLVLSGVVAAAGVGVWYYLTHHNLSGWAEWAAAKQGITLQNVGEIRLTQLYPVAELQLGTLTIPAARGNANLVEFQAAKLRVQWGSGLTPWQHLQVQQVTLTKPIINLAVDANGLTNWQFLTPDATQVQVADAPKANKANPLPLSMLAATQLNITELNLTYQNAQTKQKIIATNVNLVANTNNTIATTKLDGKINNEAIRGSVKVDLADLANLPITAQFQAAGLTVAAEGRALSPRGETASFSGQIQANATNLQQTLRTLLGQAPAGIPVGEFRLSGDLAAGTEKVALRNYALKLGEFIESSGDAVVMMGDQPSAKGSIRFQTSNLRQLASLLSSQPQPMLPASPLTLTTSLSGQDAIELPNLTLSVGNFLTVKGKLRVVPPTAAQALGVSGQLKAESSNLRTLAQAFSLPGNYPAQPFSTNLTLSTKGDTYHFENLTATIADVAQLQGNLALTPPTPQTDLQASGNLSLTGQNLQQAASQFGLNAKNIPANAFNASAQVQGQGSVQLNNLVVNLPQLLQATGNATITPGSVLNVQSKLNISQLNGNAFPACAATVAGSSPAAAAGAGKASATGAAPWSDAPLNLSALRTLGLDLNIAASGITCAAYPVTSLTTRLVNTPSQLDVKETLITFSNGGSVNLTSKLEHAGTPALSLQTQITNLAVQDWVRFLAEKGLQLPLNGELRLTAAGNTTRQLAQSLGGMVNLNASSGQLPYSNMLGQLTGLSQLVQGQAGGIGAGDGRIDSLKAAFMLTNGQADTTELNLSTGQGAMVLTGSGQIDLANWQLNYRLTPSITGGKGLAIPIVARGSLSAPAISADPEFVKKLTSRLAAEGIKGALGLDQDKAKGLGGVVGDVLSGQGVSQESVGNLLQNVLGKKPAPAAEPTSPSSPAEAAPADNTAAPVQQLLQGILGQ